MDEQARARSKQRRAMADELERRERSAANSLSDLQRARANLAEQMRRMRETKIARKRAELRTQASTAAMAAAAAVAEAAAAGEAAHAGDDAAPQVDAETLTLLRSSLQVRWSTDHVKYDATMIRELFSRFGEVVHVSMRKASRKAGPNRSAVVVMANSTAASDAYKKAAATCRHPLLVMPLPKVADVDGLAVAAPGAAQAAAAKLRRADIASAAASAPPVNAAVASISVTGALGTGAAGVNPQPGAPASFPGARGKPAGAPSSFPSSFPGAAPPTTASRAPADVWERGAGSGAHSARVLDGLGPTHESTVPSAMGPGSAAEAVGDDGYREAFDTKPNRPLSAAAKQRETLRARLLAQAEAEDELEQSE